MKRYFSVAVITASLFSTGAHALDADTTATAAAAPEGLTEIVVTAERREENLQKAAIAVTAITEDDLQKAGFNSQGDLDRLVPSISIFVGGGGSTQAFVRGVGNQAGNTYAEQAVAFNLDGEYLARGEAISGNFFDLARIEVLKGPQGTLYGRNTSAGAINLVTQKPVLGELGGDFQAEVGNYGKYSVEGAVNVPTSDDSAIRVAGQRVYHNGYLSDGYDDQDETDGRVTWYWKASEDLSLHFSADTSRSGGMGSTGVLVPQVGPFWEGPSTPQQQARWIAAGVKPDEPNGFLDITSKGGRLQIDWNTPIGTVTLLPTFRKLDENTLHYAAGFPVGFDQHSETKSFEGRLTSPQDQRLTWIVGYYLFDEHASFDLSADQTQFIAQNAIDSIKTNSHAEFGQATFKITDTLRFVAGARYTSEDKSTAGGTKVAPADVLPLVPFTPINNSLSETKVTWKAGLEYDVAPASLLYLTAATGFKAGGFYASPDGVYKPESLTSYTIGSKNEFLDRRLQLNAEAYYWKYKDEQVSYLGFNALGGIDQITTNAGDANFWGIEPEAKFLVTQADLLSANVQFEHSVFERFTYASPAPIATTCPSTAGPPPFVVNCSGFPVPNTPKWSALASYSHTFALFNSGSLVSILTGHYKSSNIGGQEQLPTEKYGGYGTADYTLTYDHPGDRWSVTAYVYNLTDRETYIGSYLYAPVGPITVQNPPRLFGMRFNSKF